MNNLTGYLMRREYGLFVQQGIDHILEEKVATNSTLELSYRVPLSARSTFCIAFSPDRRKIATSHGDHTVRISDCFKMKIEHVLKGHLRTPWCVEFHPKINSFLASGCLSGQVFIWNLDSKDPIGSLVYHSQTAISSIAFHPIDSVLAIATGNHVIFYDWNQFKVLRELTTNTEIETVRYLKFLPLGDKLITGIRNLPSQIQNHSRVSTFKSEDSASSFPKVGYPANCQSNSQVFQNTSQMSSLNCSKIHDLDSKTLDASKSDKKHFDINLQEKEESKLNVNKVLPSSKNVESLKPNIYYTASNVNNERNCNTKKYSEKTLIADKIDHSTPDNSCCASNVASCNPKKHSTLNSYNTGNGSYEKAFTANKSSNKELQNCSRCRENAINQNGSPSSSSSLLSINGHNSEIGTAIYNRQVTRRAAEASANQVMHEIMETELHIPAVRLLIARTFAARGSIAVASNIVETTNRIQLWSSSIEREPDIGNYMANVIIPRCKVHNDNSIDISSDGSLLAAFLPTTFNSPMDVELQVISLRTESFLNCIYSRKFGPNAVSVSLSPLHNYIVVGLASRKFERDLGVPPKQVIGQVLELRTDLQKHNDSKVFNIIRENSYTNEYYFSVNTVRFHPTPGMGIVYGSNRGHIQHFQIGPDLNLMKSKKVKDASLK